MRRRSFYLISTLLAGLSCAAIPASAANVYAGCDTPVTSPTGHVWYVDPVNGSMQGDGSQAHPWQTLAGVVAAGLFANMPTHWSVPLAAWVNNKPNAPINPGDTVYLLSGDHGAVTIQGAYGKGLVGYNNSSFVTIAALPGQTPVLDQLSIAGGSHWVFHGLTIQGLNPTGIYVMATTNSSKDYWLVSMTGPHDNIIIDGNNVLSTADTSQWAIGDWVTNRSSGIYESIGTCIAITNNTINNIGFGIQSQQSNNILIQGNTINYFSDDGIDYGSNNMLMQNNVITNSIEDGDGFHRDGMQGQPYSEQTTNNNVSIINNTVIRIKDPNIKFPGFLQGIDAFDGTWTNVTVTGNTIVTDAVQGLSFYGVSNSTISNNILLADGGEVLPCYGLAFNSCLSLSVIYDTGTDAIPTMTVNASKLGSPSTGVTVTQNIVSGIVMSTTDAGVTVGQNLVVLTNGACFLGLLVNGQMSWVGKPGTYSNSNIISKSSAAGIFTTYDPVNMNYNLTLLNPNLVL